ncbi:glycosyltransferase family 4 protein [Candidatus Omnitrophota bacterium]
MKIAIDARPINNKHRHGILNYTEKLIFSLSQIDNFNEYFLFFTSLRKKPAEVPGPQNSNFNKKVMRIPDSNFPLRKFLLAKIALPLFMEKYKCSILHSTFDPLSMNLKNARYILTVHDLKSLKTNEDKWPQDLKSYDEALKKADLIIAVSHSTKKDIMEHFSIQSQKIKVIYEGVDEVYKKINTGAILENKNKSISISKKYGLTKKFFLATGRVPRKNAARLIKAFSLFKYKRDFDLLILGVHPEHCCASEYFSIANRLNLNGSVKFTGYLTDERDLIYLYNRAECFVFPSLYEGFGLPVLEAMASGTPVISSNNSSLPEIGGDASLYVDPYSEEEIAKAMEKIVEDSELKHNLIRNGFVRSKQFSWQKMAKETLEIYENLAVNQTNLK